ncbi:MAG: heme-copper oxidase subunit III [Proteobacteria bacterium]|nr:heme-copper oxidase subunit III [Pseudomonadota bacterium]MCP4916384.1 heme-copper oxidase subunit III [Pseudomonadota bacterium]
MRTLERREVVPSPVLAMALFLFTETTMFLGLLSTYLILRTEIGSWPPAGQPRLPVEVTGVNTLVLLASGVVAWRLLRAWDEGGEPAARRLLAWTTVLGVLFLVIQGREWVELVSFGLTFDSGLYGATFTLLIGAHALHLAVAVLAMIWGWYKVGRGLTRGGLGALRLYWFFVVGIWPLLYGLVYLW